MTYKELLKKLAKEHNTTTTEVDNEMRKAIKSAGIEMEPSLFISLCTAKIKRDYKS